MNRKMVIEITAEGITKTFTDEDGKVYMETWKREDYGASCDSSITSQLDQNGIYEDEELLEILDSGDLDELWEHFEELEGRY